MTVHRSPHHATTRPLMAAALAIVLVPTLAQAQAQAQAQVALTGRLSVNHLYYFGGFAISGDEGADGAPPPLSGDLKTGIPVTDLQPATLAIAGSDHHDIRYLSWSGTLDEQWDQHQTWQLQPSGADLLLQGEGHARVTQTSQVCGPTGCFAASQLHWSTNALGLDFTLDAATGITLSGSTRGGQWIDLLRWVPAASRWLHEIHGPSLTRDTGFALQRTLQPGLYRVQNNSSRFVGGATNVDNAWDYALTLHDAVPAAPVPEPAPAALLAAGLAWLAWRRRPQAGS